MPTKKKSNTRKNTQGQSVLRQLSGAVIGGTLALGLYYSYEYGTPIVTAWLDVPQGQYTVESTEAAQKSIKEGEQQRISQRAQYVVNKFGQTADVPPPKKGVPDNWDLDAIANAEQAGDEGWGGYTDEWPEPPVVEEEDHGAADEWDAVWDDTWDDEFEALESLSYNSNALAAADEWDDTWEDTYWEGGSEAPIAATTEVAPAYEYEEPAEVAPIAHAPANLPSSGLELWLAMIITLCGAMAIHSKRIMKLVRG
jgi:hypothetical protein